MLHMEIIAICSEINKNTYNALCVQNLGFLSIKLGGRQCNHLNSKG
jgi:hypothetical protein